MIYRIGERKWYDRLVEWLRQLPPFQKLQSWLTTMILINRINNWFRSNTSTINKIRWQAPDSTFRTYAFWDEIEKKELKDKVLAVAFGNQLDLAEAEPLATFSRAPGDITIRTIWTVEVARNFFIAHVAHSLYIEIFERIPWRLSSLSDDQLAILFDSYEYFHVLPSGNYEIEKYYSGGVTYGDPQRIYRFVAGQGWIGTDHYESIINLLRWCSKKMVHFIGQPDYENAFNHWQYYGFPPVERILQGTIRTISPTGRIGHYTLGCYGTSGFLRAVLRLLNIPVGIIMTRNGHTLPHFKSIDKYLSHGDDPYMPIIQYDDVISPESLLINAETYRAWFIDAADTLPNVGRRIADLALLHLPFYLLYIYCQDIASAATHSEGMVANEFAGNYSLEYLEAADLWDRMDAKLIEIGGCIVINRRYEELMSAS